MVLLEKSLDSCRYVVEREEGVMGSDIWSDPMSGCSFGRVLWVSGGGGGRGVVLTGPLVCVESGDLLAC